MLKNNYPRVITIKKVEIKNVLNGLTAEQENLTVEPGRPITFKFDETTQLIPGQKEQFSFTITYHRYKGTIEHNISGTSTVNVQEAPTTIPYCGDGNIGTNEACDPPNNYDGMGGWTCKSDCTINT